MRRIFGKNRTWTRSSRNGAYREIKRRTRMNVNKLRMRSLWKGIYDTWKMDYFNAKHRRE